MKAVNALTGIMPLVVQPGSVSTHGRQLPQLPIRHATRETKAARQISRSTADYGGGVVPVWNAPDIFPRDTTDIRIRPTEAMNALLTDVLVGTPPQRHTVMIDTGSADTWLPAADSDYCKDNGCPAGSYSSDDSNSSTISGPDQFVIRYGDGSIFTGDYVKDDLSFGNLSLSDWTFAQVDNAETTVPGYTGVLGLGPSDSQTGVVNKAFAKYPSLLEKMKEQGDIDRLGFSLQLPQQEDDSGSLLFGGIDTTKFVAPLQGIPLDDTARISAQLDQIHATEPESNGDQQTALLAQPLSVVLDSGSGLTYLPKDVLDGIIDTYDGKEVNGDYYISSEAATDDHVLRFQLGTASIGIPLADFVQTKAAILDSPQLIAAVVPRWDDEQSWSDSDAKLEDPSSEEHEWQDVAAESESLDEASDVPEKEHSWTDNEKIADEETSDKEHSWTDNESMPAEDSSAKQSSWTDNDSIPAEESSDKKFSWTDDESIPDEETSDNPSWKDFPVESHTSAEDKPKHTAVWHKPEGKDVGEEEVGYDERVRVDIHIVYENEQDESDQPEHKLPGSESWTDIVAKRGMLPDDEADVKESWTDESYDEGSGSDEQSWTDIEAEEPIPEKDVAEDEPEAKDYWGDSYSEETTSEDKVDNDSSSEYKPASKSEWKHVPSDEDLEKGESSVDKADAEDEWSDTSSEQVGLDKSDSAEEKSTAEYVWTDTDDSKDKTAEKSSDSSESWADASSEDYSQGKETYSDKDITARDQHDAEEGWSDAYSEETYPEVEADDEVDTEESWAEYPVEEDSYPEEKPEADEYEEPASKEESEVEPVWEDVDAEEDSYQEVKPKIDEYEEPASEEKPEVDEHERPASEEKPEVDPVWQDVDAEENSYPDEKPNADEYEESATDEKPEAEQVWEDAGAEEHSYPEEPQAEEYEEESSSKEKPHAGHIWEDVDADEDSSDEMNDEAPWDEEDSQHWSESEDYVSDDDEYSPKHESAQSTQ